MSLINKKPWPIGRFPEPATRHAELPCLLRLGAVPPQKYELFRNVTSVGSSRDNDIMIAEETIASHHARITQRRLGRFFIADLHSGTSTLINGVRVEKSAKMRSGDEVQFGDVQMVFLYPTGTARRERTRVLALEIAALLFFLLLLAISQMDLLVWFRSARQQAGPSAPTASTPTTR
jgi:FHA domain